MTPAQLRKLRGKRTQKEAVKLTGYSLRQYCRFERGEVVINPRAAKILRDALK